MSGVDRLLEWLRNALAVAALLTRQVVGSLRDNWGVGVLSVVLAAALWVFVTDRDNPEQTGRVPGTVPIEVVNVPPDQAVVSLSRDSVVLRVRAPENVLEDLTADDFRARIDLSAVSAQEVTVEVRVESQEPRVQVVEVTPSRVTVRLESVTSRIVPVRPNLIGTPSRGFEAQEVLVEPQEAVVTGPESLVERVEAAEADVNLTGLRTDFEQRLLLQARDQRGGVIQGVTVEPETALVRVDMVQLEFSAVFVVVPDVSGAAAEGFSATAIEVAPSFVLVSGPADVFQSIDQAQGIRTEPISIDGASSDVVRTVALRLPPGARVEQGAVTVRIVIRPTALPAPGGTPGTPRP